MGKERFEDHLKTVEDIVRAMEAGNLDLEASLEKYEQAKAALKACYAILEQAEKKIETLVKQPDGTLAGEPMAATPPKKKKDEP
jgi:exodeoxyribonuclease VII small subunit